MENDGFTRTILHFGSLGRGESFSPIPSARTVPAAAAAMADAGFPLEVRPDKLTVADFVTLTRAVMPYLERE